MPLKHTSPAASTYCSEQDAKMDLSVLKQLCFAIWLAQES